MLSHVDPLKSDLLVFGIKIEIDDFILTPTEAGASIFGGFTKTIGCDHDSHCTTSMKR